MYPGRLSTRLVGRVPARQENKSQLKTGEHHEAASHEPTLLRHLFSSSPHHAQSQAAAAAAARANRQHEQGQEQGRAPVASGPVGAPGSSHDGDVGGVEVFRDDRQCLVRHAGGRGGNRQSRELQLMPWPSIVVCGRFCGRRRKSQRCGVSAHAVVGRRRHQATKQWQRVKRTAGRATVVQLEGNESVVLRPTRCH